MESAAIPAKRGRPTAEDARKKMEFVLTVAREQFCERGYRAVTMRDVADKAQVSTRTLYNRYADKLSLFAACLDQGAEEAFPSVDQEQTESIESALKRYALTIVEALSAASNVSLSMLIYREGPEFPELLQAAEANQHRFLVQPLAAFLQQSTIALDDAESSARLFVAMALSEWQRSVTFRHPFASQSERESHATLVTRVFLYGHPSRPCENIRNSGA